MNSASTKAIFAFCLYQLTTLFVLFFPPNFSQYEGRCQSYVLGIDTTMHYGIRAMWAMSLRIPKLCLSFSAHPNISSFFSHANIPYKCKRAQLSLDQMKKKEKVKVKS